MRPFATLGIFCTAALLAGCGALHSAQQSATDGFHSGFRTSFKSSFIKSCASEGAPEKTCACIEGKVEAANTDDQLMKLDPDSDATKKMLGDDARACAAEK